jgi:single-stranded-DNA-specific exonuclease
MKKWVIQGNLKSPQIDDIVEVLLKNRGLTNKKEIQQFLDPPKPSELTAKDVGIEEKSLAKAIARIGKAIEDKESVVVYADYDADGITAGAVMWETIYRLGGNVMPYIPHRVKEGYGLSEKGIDAIREKYQPTLVITVDHGITAWEKVKYAREKGIDVIVTDHHVKPPVLPDCTIVHTTQLSGAGVSWFVANALMTGSNPVNEEGVALAAIGTIADMVPLVGANRSIAKRGLQAINETKRVGILALLADAGIPAGSVGTYEISHMIAPRLNAAGRIEHAMDALRLLCTRQDEKATILARKLGLTNKERQQMTTDTANHAIGQITSLEKKLLFVTSDTYNQGIIGLVAGRLVEEFYRPAIVVAKGEKVSKASARSIVGFNIVEALRSASDILVDVGGHPMAAGFTVETKYLAELQERLERLVDKELDEEKLTRVLRVDAAIPLSSATEELWEKLLPFEPHGFGNPQPVFVSSDVTISDTRLVGAEGKHLKLTLLDHSRRIPAIAFSMGELYGKLPGGAKADIAYTVDMNTWNGNKELQLKVKDIHLH